MPSRPRKERSIDWERLWRSAGIQFVVAFTGASIAYGSAPKGGASADDLVSFYEGDRTRILIAVLIYCLAFRNLMWFGAAAAVIIVVLGGTTCATDGFWAPDGAYRYFEFLVMPIWITFASALLTRRLSKARVPEPAPAPTTAAT